MPDRYRRSVAGNVTEGLERKLAQLPPIWGATILESSACTDSNVCGMRAQCIACEVNRLRLWRAERSLVR
jgi:hypothetical protein